VKNSWRIAISDSISSLIYRFSDFELDSNRFELRRAGQPIHVEPQVLSLLILLVANSERMIRKEELVDRIWGRRYVTDAAIASRIKSARHALGDDGKRQCFIRTVHSQGVRFVAPVTYRNAFSEALPSHASDANDPGAGDVGDPDLKPSIAILPFEFTGEHLAYKFLAHALADELITDLSRLRWLLVIARGSSFRFTNPNVDRNGVGRALGVRFILSGTVQQQSNGVEILVELTRAPGGEIVWAERFSAGSGDLDQFREELVGSVVANLEIRIPQDEAQLARHRPVHQLDAWSAYHRGLDLMYRFNGADNQQATGLFAHALSRDDKFSRALAGLSFTRFQDAFMQYSDDHDAAARDAWTYAERARELDPLDPFAYLTLGRSLWLQGEVAGSVDIIDHAIRLSPNYAQALYSRAWATMMQGSSEKADLDATMAMRLSPLDPLRYAMLGVRCLSALMRGDYEMAAVWGTRAGRTPGAHKHIAIIAALATQANGENDRATEWVASARLQDPDISAQSFLRSFPFAETASRGLIEATLRDLHM
jgi:TolB-like protein/cytochrome c-type biogenesis protein CcmH/NrfG